MVHTPQLTSALGGGSEEPQCIMVHVWQLQKWMAGTVLELDFIQGEAKDERDMGARAGIIHRTVRPLQENCLVVQGCPVGADVCVCSFST